MSALFISGVSVISKILGIYEVGVHTVNIYYQNCAHLYSDLRCTFRLMQTY